MAMETEQEGIFIGSKVKDFIGLRESHESTTIWGQRVKI